eukprot:323479-Hanusia_phi.AAC.1
MCIRDSLLSQTPFSDPLTLTPHSSHAPLPFLSSCGHVQEQTAGTSPEVIAGLLFISASHTPFAPLDSPHNKTPKPRPVSSWVGSRARRRLKTYLPWSAAPQVVPQQPNAEEQQDADRHHSKPSDPPPPS